jgi:PAS domain S-box-containing protein
MQNNLYQEIVTNMLEGVMVISMKGHITMLNAAAESVLGIGQESVGDLYMNVFLDKAENDAFSEVILNTIYEKKKVSNMPIDYVLDGKTKNLSLTTSFVQAQGEKSVVVVMEDITKLTELRDARVALEKITKLNIEYEKAKNEAELANNAKSRFLSNMSHEIRTPINAVLGMNEMILRECDDSQIRTYASNIESSGKTLLFLINDILDLSKIESGKMEIIPVEYEPATVLMDLWNVIYFRAQEKDLALCFDVDKTLPQKLYGDDVRIKQIVTNLLTNAVKYTPSGSVELRLRYEKQGDDRLSLIISVIDTGMGIKKEDMGKLFESFQRLDEKKNRNIEGTGLGMSITTSLIELMGGELKVESEYQKGSNFTVIIPQKIVDMEPTGDFEQIKKHHESKNQVRSAVFEAPEANILVVDDNAMNLTVIKSLLKRTKVGIVTAMSGKECLELAAKQKFHIIFMDHMMPDMDGIETLHELRKITDGPNIDTPVIALTANAVSGIKELYLKEGFSDYLTKPIDSILLEKTIYNYLPKDIVREAKEVKNNAADNNGETNEEIAFDDYLAYGISVKNGLSYAKKDMDIYLDLIRMFINDSETRKRLTQYADDKNMKDYAVLVHSLKGNARTLGADTLADIAYKHEMESKAGNSDYVVGEFDKLLAAWNTSLEGFGKLYGIYKKVEAYSRKTPEDGGKMLELSRSDFDMVIGLIEKFEEDKAISILKEWLENPLKESAYEKVRAALVSLEDEFDEDKAMEILGREEY